MSDVILSERTTTFVMQPGGRLRVEIDGGRGVWELALETFAESIGLKTIVEIRRVAVR